MNYTAWPIILYDSYQTLEELNQDLFADIKHHYREDSLKSDQQ
jgi:hypothetical protein